MDSVDAKAMKQVLHRLLREDSGQDLVEYALLVALIAIVSVLGLTTLGPSVSGFYDRLGAFFSSL